MMKAEVMAFVEKTLISLIADFFQTLPLYSTADFRADISTVKRRLKAEGLSFATITLPLLSQGLFDHIEGRKASYPSFKLWDGTYPVFLKGLFQNALGLNPKVSHCDHDLRARYVEAIYQISVCFKKLKGPYKRCKLAEQYADFVRTDEALGQLDFDNPELQPIIERAQHLARIFLRGYDPYKDAIPRPGPGATNQPTKKYERYEPHILFTSIHETFDYTEWFFTRPEDAFPVSAPSILGTLRVVDEPTSRFKFVPKTWAKARGICIESFEVQWLQQAIRRSITKHLERHPFYSKRITLNDQSTNAWMAIMSSVSKTFATLDMSEASDRVARELVMKIFASHDEFVTILEALSTKWIEPPREAGKGFKGMLSTNKFAPMGSALCFPIMSLVHMFLIRAIIQLYAPKLPHLHSTNVFVYGDDLVLPSSCVHLVYEWLPKFGMKLNETKSFYHSHFRESCGTHAYYGHDITPTYVREIPKFGSGSAINSIIETEYQFHRKGLHSAAHTMRDSLIRLSKSVDRYVPVSSNVLGFKRDYGDPAAQNDKCFPPYNGRVRYDRDVQSFSRLEWVLEAKTTAVGLSSDIHRYLRWFCEKPDSRMIADTSDGVLIRKKWVPLSACALF
jgi:hypothetical protein